MRRIEKKTWPDLFQKVLEEKKTFDVRLADFNCKPGDILILREWEPKTQEYTGRVVEKKITFVLKTKDIKFWTKREISKYGLQVIGLK